MYNYVDQEIMLAMLAVLTFCLVLNLYFFSCKSSLVVYIVVLYNSSDIQIIIFKVFKKSWKSKLSNF